MFQCKFPVRFSETDALGHVNHASYYVYMEEARRPLYELVNPGLGTKTWNLIIARTSCDYLRQVAYGEELRVDTYVQSIGNKSLTIRHELYSETSGYQVAVGEAVAVYFNFQEQKSELIPDDLRAALLEHLITV
ncbi:MAG: thioesterase [Bacilli bacterium]|nr:thioesterase [Bacilli bacterium]